MSALPTVLEYRQRIDIVTGIKPTIEFKSVEKIRAINIMALAIIASSVAIILTTSGLLPLSIALKGIGGGLSLLALLVMYLIRSHLKIVQRLKEEIESRGDIHLANRIIYEWKIMGLPEGKYEVKQGQRIEDRMHIRYYRKDKREYRENGDYRDITVTETSHITFASSPDLLPRDSR